MPSNNGDFSNAAPPARSLAQTGERPKAMPKTDTRGGKCTCIEATAEALDVSPMSVGLDPENGTFDLPVSSYLASAAERLAVTPSKAATALGRRASAASVIETRLLRPLAGSGVRWMSSSLSMRASICASASERFDGPGCALETRAPDQSRRARLRSPERSAPQALGLRRYLFRTS